MTIQVIAVREGTKALFHPEPFQVKALLQEHDVRLWVMLDEGGEAERQLLEQTFGIHPLLVEDVFIDATAPKIEDHDGYLYVILHGLRPETIQGGKVEVADLDVFLGRTYLITHHHKDLPAVPRVREALEKDPSILARGPAFVAHRLFDLMIDQYFPLMDRLDAEVTKLEEEVVREQNSRAVLTDIFELKHDLLRIRKTGLYQRDILHRLSRGDFPLIPEKARPFYRDLYDHFVRITDETETYREMVSSSLEAHLSVQSHRLNEVMKVLTLISTMVLPLNFITGLYGMNFEYMPGLHWRFGYQTAIVVMITTIVGLSIFFRRQKWF